MVFLVQILINLHDVNFDEDDHEIIFVTQTNTGTMVKRVPHDQVVGIRSCTSIIHVRLIAWLDRFNAKHVKTR